MTKDTEIALLDKTIKAFGPNSYLGPWLADNRMRLIDDIQNDVSPSAPFPLQAKREASDLLHAARAEADALLFDAKKKADELIAKATDTSARIKSDARRALEAVLARIY